MTLRRMVAFVALLLFAAAAPAAAQTFPKFTGFVVDAANVLPPETEAALAAKLDALQKDTHRQLIVATIPDLQGYPLEEYGYKLGRAWGVGLKDVNNGIILFIAPNEAKGHRGPRIEVGTGLEPVVTDALASVIINQDMMPKLQAGDVPGAMTAGTDSIIAQLRATPDEAKARTDAAIADFDRQHRRSADSGGGFPIGFVIWAMIIGFVILSGLRGRGRGKRYRSGHAPVILWGPSLGNWGSGGGSSWSSGGGGSSWGSSDSGGSSWGGGGFSGGGGGSSWGSSDSGGSSWGGGGFSGGGGGSFGGGGASGGW